MFSRRVRESVSGYVEVDIPYKVGPGLRPSDGQNFPLHEWLDQAEWIGCLCRPVRFIGDLLGSGGSLALVPCSTIATVLTDASGFMHEYCFSVWSKAQRQASRNP